jgi:hypothetical protein
LLVDLSSYIVVFWKNAFFLGLLEHHFLFDQTLEHLKAGSCELKGRKLALLTLSLLLDRSFDVLHFDDLSINGGRRFVRIDASDQG